MEDKSRNMAESRLKGLIMLGGLDLYPIWNKKPTGDDQKNIVLSLWKHVPTQPGVGGPGSQW